MKMLKVLEYTGAGLGIVGALLVATKNGQFGYPFFLVSSAFLLYTCFRQKQMAHMGMQGVFFAINVIGAFNYV